MAQERLPALLGRITDRCRYPDLPLGVMVSLSPAITAEYPVNDRLMIYKQPQVFDSHKQLLEFTQSPEIQRLYNELPLARHAQVNSTLVERPECNRLVIDIWNPNYFHPVGRGGQPEVADIYLWRGHRGYPISRAIFVGLAKGEMIRCSFSMYEDELRFAAGRPPGQIKVLPWGVHGLNSYVN